MDDFTNKNDDELINETNKILSEDDDIVDVSDLKKRIAEKQKEEERAEFAEYNPVQYNKYESSYVPNEYTSSYTSSNSVDYNNYSENASRSDIEFTKKVAKFMLIGFFSLAIFAFIFCIMLLNMMDDIDYSEEYNYDENFYDVRYDYDNDGYMSYDEEESYYLDKSKVYEKNFIVEEVFIDKQNKLIYFEIENNNEYSVSDIEIKFAYYDANGELVDTSQEYLYDYNFNDKVLIKARYQREFETYDLVIIADTEYNTSVNNTYIDVKATQIEDAIYNEGKVKYTLQNNGSSAVRGYVYAIFYDFNDNIINIESNYVSDLTSGETISDNIYVFNELNNYSRIEINTSALVEE